MLLKPRRRGDTAAGWIVWNLQTFPTIAYKKAPQYKKHPTIIVQLSKQLLSHRNKGHYVSNLALAEMHSRMRMTRTTKPDEDEDGTIFLQRISVTLHHRAITIRKAPASQPVCNNRHQRIYAVQPQLPMCNIRC